MMFSVTKPPKKMTLVAIIECADQRYLRDKTHPDKVFIFLLFKRTRQTFFSMNNGMVFSN